MTGNFSARPVLCWFGAAWLALAQSSALADFADTIARAKASVVAIGVYKETSTPRFSFRGTGFVVGDGNTVITSAHVLPEGIDSDFKSSVLVQVRDAAGTLQPRDTQVLAIDKAHDLAVLRIGGSQVPVMQIGNSDHVREGQPVAFMGFPMGGALGYSLVSHRGWVSAITPVVLPVPAAGQLSERSVRVMRNGAFSVFQLDGTAYPGNSGGPLVDPESGEVLGVINMVFVKGAKETALSNPSGISYAVPANWAQSLLRPAR